VLEIVLLVALAAGYYGFWWELPWRNPYTWAALLLLAGAAIDTVVTASSPTKALGIWKAYFVEPMLAGLLIAAMAARRDQARLLLAGLGLAGAISALLNIANTLRALATHSFDDVTPPVAIYKSANDIAMYLEPLAAVALAIAVFTEERLERLAAAALYGLFALAIALSFSRAGWLTLAVLSIAVAFFHRRRLWVIGAAAALAALAFLASGRVRSRVLVEFDLNNPRNTLSLRRSLWETSLRMLEHRPLFGGGLNGFQGAIQPYKTNGYGENLIYPHNLVLNFWSETGLLGLAGFTWVVVQALRTVIRGLSAGPWPRALAIGTLGALVALLVHGLVDAPYFKNDLALAFWAILGIQTGSLLRR
jgi:O-antigen ligase